MEPQQPMSPAPAPTQAPAPDMNPASQVVTDPTAPMQAQPMSAAPIAGNDPGKGLGIASLVTGLLGMGLIGLILGIIAKGKSKKAGHKNGLALAGIIVSVISMIGTLIVVTLISFGAVKLAQKCDELGSGTHVVDGVTYTCPVK